MASILKQSYTVQGKNGKRIKKKSTCWYVDYKTEDGTRKRVKGFKDKAATIQFAAELERNAELARRGIIDRHAEDRKKPLRKHLEDFHQSLLAKGSTVAHTKQTSFRAEEIINHCKFVMWTDISASKVQRCLADMRDKEDGLSVGTSNAYLQAIKQFCRWMVQDGRASESPLTHLKRMNVKVDRRHERRALEPDEMRRLLATTLAGRKRFGMEGFERALLYKVAAETGLRANELRSLKVSSFDLEACTVRVRCSYTKNKNKAEISIRPDTAAELKNFFAGRLPDVKAFGGTLKRLTGRTALMLQADLADAGIPYVDDAGLYADFHALRHTTGSLLAATGCHPKIAQSIMRHGDINLTMSLYTHTLRGQESEAVKNLPDLSLSSKESLRATGTNGMVVETDSGAYKKLAKNPYLDSHQPSSIGTEDRSKSPDNGNGNTSHKPLAMTTLGTEKAHLSSGDIDSESNTPEHAQNSAQRIQ
ncbi:MAG: tyrosine-type recombinase/integrase [Phycisphaerales bacterium]|nr:MAG: tyrosine-type recombinase/integrase [Phycisphaerales bacterium]